MFEGDTDTDPGEPFTLEDVFELSPRKLSAQWLPGILSDIIIIIIFVIVIIIRHTL